ncbi:MAG: hypothetical protein ACOYN8_12855 [Pseudanabaena sp.]|jgi:predicted HTH domain antitoxin
MCQDLLEPDVSLQKAMELAEVSLYMTASINDYAEIGMFYDQAIAANFNISSIE